MNDGTRRAAGIGLVVLGLAMVVISAVGLLTSGGDDADTAAPVPETAPSETPAPTENAPRGDPMNVSNPAPFPRLRTAYLRAIARAWKSAAWESAWPGSWRSSP